MDGPGFLPSDVDRYLKSILGSDVLFQSYTPGGLYSTHPPEGQPVAGSPCGRWWCQTPGKDARRQDAHATRILSRPCFVVGVLDRQKMGQFSLLGSNGHVDDGARRIRTLLDGVTNDVTFSTGTFRIYSQCETLAPITESDSGDILLVSGVLACFTVQ